LQAVLAGAFATVALVGDASICLPASGSRLRAGRSRRSVCVGSADEGEPVGRCPGPPGGGLV